MAVSALDSNITDISAFKDRGGKSVLISGGSGGIGSAFARAFAAADLGSLYS